MSLLKLKKYRLLSTVILSALIFSGCDTTGGSQAVVDDDPYSTDIAYDKPDTLHETKTLTYLDSEAIDIDISKATRKHYQQIELAVPSKFPLHDIPERIEHWLAYIKKHGGEVQAQAISDEDSASRGVILTILEVAISYIISNQDDEMYDPAEYYNARLYYNKDTGEIEQVLFYLRD